MEPRRPLDRPGESHAFLLRLAQSVENEDLLLSYTDSLMVEALLLRLGLTWRDDADS